MKVFLSWSGQQSRAVAVALYEWLPSVINALDPFVSSEDIDPGTRWQMEVAQQLDDSNFGIVCVTRANQASPWLNFEAGALAKAVETSRVVPLAIDLKPSDVELPLGQFQAQPASQSGIARIVKALNAALDQPLAEGFLEKALTKWWPDLEATLKQIEQEPTDEAGAQAPARSERELLEEVLNTVRSLARARPASSAKLSLRGKVTHDHPLVKELESMLSPVDEEARVVCARDRRAVAISARQPLPTEIKDSIRERGDLYDVDVEFLDRSLRDLLRERAEFAVETASPRRRFQAPEVAEES